MNTIKEFFIFLRDLLLDYMRSRLFPVTVLMVLLSAALTFKLYDLQIINGDTYSQTIETRSEKTISIRSIRGNIYDRNGTLLAYNKLSYNVTIENVADISSVAKSHDMTTNELLNKICYDTLSILHENGDELSVSIPIELKDGKYEYTASGTSLKMFLRNVYSVNSYDDLTPAEKNTSAENMIRYMRYGDDTSKGFGVDERYSDEEALELLAIRYALFLNRFQQYVSVVISDDVSEKSRNDILEHSDELLGIGIDTDYKRVYNDSIYFSHILGYVGQASQDEINSLNEDIGKEAYKSGAVIGKSGIEQSYESYLHGEDGEEHVYVDNLGKIIESIDKTDSTIGNDVYLTLDAGLQKYCYDILEQEIAAIIVSRMINLRVANNTDIEVIPVNYVYFALFNNGLISLDNMAEIDATDHEKSIYSSYQERKQTALSNLSDQLGDYPQLIGSLSAEYLNYSEYICEMLSKNKAFNSSMVPLDDPMRVKFGEGQITLRDYLEYLIDIEAIDISVITDKDEYYDSDETYNVMTEYILEELKDDSEFDLCVVRSMIDDGTITSDDCISLLYEQGFLMTEGDQDLKNYRAGAIDSFEYMTRKIKNLEITPAMLAIEPYSGSIVVTDCQTGEIRALVSYPSYDNNIMANSVDVEAYNKLIADKSAPMYNRATMTGTAPGSTFKIISSIAGLSEEVIKRDTYIGCTGVYENVYNKPQCWIYRQYGGVHGPLELSRAIDLSCNFFFYEVGFRLATKNGTYRDSTGLAYLRKYAQMFGLGEKSGIEISEISPHISDSDAVRSAIGQGTHSYTATQLSKYITGVANRGAVFDLSLVGRAVDSDGNVTYNNQHELYNQVYLEPESWDTIDTGLRLVVTDDLYSHTFLNSLNVSISGKTGTAQVGTNHPANALFVSFAPSESPEYSVTTVIQNGYTSGNAADTTAYIYAYLFDKKALEDTVITVQTTDTGESTD